MKDEALKLALEAMERYQVKRQDFDRFADEITAIKQALANDALDRKAENARELGLDYEPYKGISEHMTQATKGRVRIDPVTGDVGIGTPPAAAQRQWVGLTVEEKNECASPYDSRLCCVEATEAKLKEKNT
jgi:hypothetical protein